MQFTTIEQGRRLVELGLPAITADMYYKKGDIKMATNGCFRNVKFFEECPECIPSWSLDALLKVLPISYQMTRERDGRVQLMLITNLRHEFYGTELEAAYTMVVWLLENGLMDEAKLRNYIPNQK